MSIIYDALQKTQYRRNSSVSRATIVLSVAGIALLSAALTTIVLSKVTAKPTQVIMNQPQLVPVTRESSTTHALNGVYLSDQENSVLIDNKFFHLGDNIGNLTIMSIEHDQVKFRDTNNLLRVVKVGETV